MWQDKSGYLDEEEIGQAARRLGFPFGSKAELQAAFQRLDADGNGRITLEEFCDWWNRRDADDPLLKTLHGALHVTPAWEG